MDDFTSKPTGTRRQAQAAARREQFLAVALDTFAEKGYRGSTMRDIAQAAGVTEGLIYHYFPSKSALLQAVLERYNLCLEMTDQIARLKDVPVREALVRLGQRYLELLETNRKYVSMVFAEAQRDPEVAYGLGLLLARGLEPAQVFLNERIAAGELRPHDVVISLRVLHHSLFWFGLMQDRLSPPLPPMDPDAFVRGAVDLVLDGLVLSPQGEQASE